MWSPLMWASWEGRKEVVKLLTREKDHGSGNNQEAG